MGDLMISNLKLKSIPHFRIYAKAFTGTSTDDKDDYVW